MDYRANVDAVSWFAAEVFPTIRDGDANAEFWIVGSNPTDAVKRLADSDAVHVTGRVPDVRPFLAHAHVVVAPLRVARGVQNKVLEALSMGKNVICTPEAAEGLAANAPLQVTHDPAAMSRMIADALNSPDSGRPHGAGGDYIQQHYGWSANLARMSDLLETSVHAVSAQSAGGKTGIAA
jgi:glycosyltransferase involved in cell wall biosynthesis